MRRLPHVLVLSVLLLFIAWPAAYAANGSSSSIRWQDIPPEVLDSLQRTKYAEPSLQEALNNLGYNIDVVNDLLPTEVWVSIVGQYSEVMLAEIAGYAPQTNSGWYGHGVPADTHVIFRGPDTPPDTSFFTITGVDSNGLFINPYAGSKPSDHYIYYTEPRFNPDLFDHAKVFCSKNRPNEFIVAWEDYYNGGDQDFNDLILLYRLPDRPPVLYLPNDTTFNICQAESICFNNIHATDPDYCGDTTAITKIAGPGVYSNGKCCFLPAPVDSIYRFIFRATDWFGATATDTILITVHISKPILSCTGDELTCDSLLASAVVTSNPSTGVTYLWTPSPTSGQGTAHARYNAPGSKKVVVTITSTGCKDSCNAVITQTTTKPVLSCSGDELTCDSLLASAVVTSNPSTGVTYLWTPSPTSGQGTAHARYNAPGTKKVVVTITATGCKDSCNAVITQTVTKPVLSCTGDELTCDSLLASADVTSNPSTGVTYLWTPSPTSGQGTAHARYNAPGLKTVIVTITASGCKDSCSAIITQNTTKPILSCTGDELTCDSLLASAIVTSNPSTGVTYLWTPSPVSGQGTAHARYDTPGTKWVVVTITATGCKDSCSAVITQTVTKPVLSCTGDELTCDSLLASAIVTSNPSTGVTYLWSPTPISGQGTAHARYDAPGLKTVIVTITASGCKDSCSAIITQNATKPILSCTGDELTCDSLLASAIVTSNPSTGVTYLWSPSPVSGQGTANARYDTPGTKKVVVTITSTGCKDSCNAVITQTTTKPILSCSGDELTCDSLLASAIVTSNPSIGVTYLWSPTPISGQGTAHARYDAPGLKTVIVTITASGCKDSCSAIITQNATKPILSCTGDELTCDSLLASAIVTSNPSTGVTYLWTPSPVSGQGTANARYDTPGTKKVVVTITSTGCKDSCNAVITQTTTKPVLSCTGDELTCDSLLASAIVTSNPSTGVTYLWTPSPVSGQGTAHARYDTPGTKWVVVTITATGCKDSCSAVITQTVTKPVLSCTGDELTCDSLLASAIVTSNPSTGVTYLWSPTPISGQGTAHARYDAPGTKWVVVTITATGCKDSCSAVITQTVTKPVLSCTGDELTCDSLLASAIVTSNPSTGVTYLWSPTPISGQGTAHARYDAPGTKWVVVTITATGCKDSCSAVITQTVTKPVLSCTGDELTCDSLLASAIVTSNPSIGVTYLWSPTPISGQGTAHARYDAPGLKTVIVTITASGCKDSCSAIITQNATKPILSCTGDELTCDSLLASAIVTSNPSTGVTYLWTPSPVSGQGTAHARYDTPGTKWVVVTITATGCKDSCSAVITQTVTKPVLSCTGDELTCDSLLASAIVTSNPSTGVTYLWTPSPVSGQGTAHARYDTPGTKWVVVTITATGCKDSCSAVITQTVTKPVLSCTGDELTCDSLLASAIVTSNPSTGVTYLWSPTPISGQGTAHARYDAPGTKWVVVTITATGCKDSCSAVITQTVTKPVLSCTGDELTCDSLLASAIVTSNPSTGVTYLWSPTPISGQGTANARYDTPGTKKVVVTITASGCKDSCSAVITQNLLPPSITCPDSMIVHSGHQSSGNFTVTQSQGDSIVQVLAWVVPSSTGISNLTVSGGTGRTPTTGHVEFDANCSYPGLYIISLEATDKCGLKDTCSFHVWIYNEAPQLVCPTNGNAHAGSNFTSTDFSVTDPDGDTAPVTFLDITPSATNNPTIVGNHVEWNTTCAENGTYTIRLEASDPCGLKDTCEFTVSVSNQPPQLTCPSDGIINTPQTFVSTDFSVTDPDGDTAPVTFLDIIPPATNNPAIVGSHVEWATTFSEFGEYIIRLVATDPCGLKDTCQFKVTVSNEHTGDLTCPEDDSIHAGLKFTSTNYSVSGPGANPDSVRIISIAPAPAHQPVKVQYHVEWQTECGDAGKVFTICLEAKDDYGDYDTCCFHVTVYNRPPQLTCPNNGSVHAGNKFTSDDFSVTDPDGDTAPVTFLSITPIATNNPTIVNSHLEWNTTCSENGNYTILLVAADVCGLKDTCEFTVNVYNHPPQITCPFNGSTDAGNLFISTNYSITDQDGDSMVVSLVSIVPPATYNPVIVGSHVEWLTVAGQAGNYIITLRVTDKCGLTSECSFTVTVRTPSSDIPNHVYIPITECVEPGHIVDLPIIAENFMPGVCFGGFELEIEFDYTAMTFVGADPGAALEQDYVSVLGSDTTFYSWEYFNYRMLPCPLCACCKYKILMLGMKDLPNGPFHQGYCICPTGVDILAVLHFVVNNDQNLQGLLIPVCFEWEGTVVDGIVVEDWDCAENTFSNCSGDTLFVSNKLCEWVADLCDDPGSITRLINFQTLEDCGVCGGVMVCSPSGEECKRGDINYNSLPYEVADAVLFASYFAEGITVFGPEPDRSIKVCATDVNHDGRALTLSDLVYLIRVILHDAVEIPKLAPSSVANVIVSNGIITTEGANIGAILFEFDSAVNPTLLASNMEMINKDGKVLVWSRSGNSIETAAQVIRFSGDAKLVSVTAVDRDSRTLTTAITAKVSPTTFALHPAYPNPFNPNTNLSFTLPEATNYSMKIYNVAGQLVRTFEGSGASGLNVITWNGQDNAGNSVSSGVYFFKLIAGTHSATEKMVMMK